MRRTRIHLSVASLLLLAGVVWSACDTPVERSAPPDRVGQSLREVALDESRTCDGPSDYPQALIDGLSRQLVAEIRCFDPRWLEFYTSCEEPGCLTANGPQLQAGRPELLDALKQVAQENQDNLRINAAYRDVGMQYFSWWKRAFCDPSFMAAVPGASNHQGGRAVDVHFHGFWRSMLIAGGFSNDVPNDLPHFDLTGDALFRQESLELRALSVKAFQTLWNRNHPNDLIDEDGVYGPQTATRLGSSPIEGFAVECPDPCLAQPCLSGCDLSLCDAWCDDEPCGAGCPESGCTSFCAIEPCGAGCDPSSCDDVCVLDPCAAGCDSAGCVDECIEDPCADGCDGTGCDDACALAPCEAGCAQSGCDAFCDENPCDASCEPSGCEDPLAICALDPCAPPCPISGCAEAPRVCDTRNCAGECVDNICVFPQSDPPTEEGGVREANCQVMSSGAESVLLLWTLVPVLWLRTRRRRPMKAAAD